MDLRRIRARLRTSRDPAYGVGDCIHRTAGSRERAFYAVAIVIVLLICSCAVDSNTHPVCLPRDAACLLGVQKQVAHMTRNPQIKCQYVVDGKIATTSQFIECATPAKAYQGVTLIQVGENGNWDSQTQRLPGKIYRIVFLSGCVKGAMC
jgi:hypothetical protein